LFDIFYGFGRLAAGLRLSGTACVRAYEPQWSVYSATYDGRNQQ